MQSIRDSAASSDALRDDLKTAVLFLRKNLLTWLSRRGVDAPADLAGSGTPGMSPEKIDDLAQLIEVLKSLGTQHDANKKLDMVHRSLMIAAPLR